MDAVSEIFDIFRGDLVVHLLNLQTFMYGGTADYIGV